MTVAPSYQKQAKDSSGVLLSIDPKKLDQAGWGVIFAQDADPNIREALRELLEHRQTQAALDKPQRYRELVYHSGESAQQFLARYDIDLYTVNPDKVPYYLLIVGEPLDIPYEFQLDLGLTYAVGRIYFETLEAYAQYASSIIVAESDQLSLARHAAFFSAEHPDDPFTQWSTRELISPLVRELAEENADWSIHTFLGNQATKAQLTQFLGDKDTPALLFTAGHGVWFPPDAPNQQTHQGALLCQGWSAAEKWHNVQPADVYFSGDDVGPDAALLGLIAIQLASYSAGGSGKPSTTWRVSEESYIALSDPFISCLPQQLLGHHKGGALAFIGQLNTMYGYTSERNLQVYQDIIRQLMTGTPVGLAVHNLALHYLALAKELERQRESLILDIQTDDVELFSLWGAAQDARNCVVVGDPAAKLKIAESKDSVAERPIIKPIKFVDATPYIPHPFNDLSVAGWGVIFAARDEQAETILKALQPLLEHRRKQATEKGDYYKEFVRGDGYRPGEHAVDFLTRHRVGQRAVTPELVPYYLLVVGDPESIPYEFQYQLDVKYAVGRLYFETIEEYANYAHSVVSVEKGYRAHYPNRIALFGPNHPQDRATEISANYLVKPLANSLYKKHPDWNVQLFVQNATKLQLCQLLGGKETPNLIFTATHMMQFSKDPPDAKSRGALLCQDWPGPQEWRGEIPKDFYFSSFDINDEANLLGLVAFLWPVGTNPLIPQRLLGHPNGGAQAMIGHIGGAWSSSFIESGNRPRIYTFFDTLSKLIVGETVGLAMTSFNQYYSELATGWVTQSKEVTGELIDSYEYEQRKNAILDARNFVVFGDPAVRLPTSQPTDDSVNLPTVSLVPQYVEPASITFELHNLAPFADLSRVGWGIIFSAKSSIAGEMQALREVLKPLLNLRQQQAGEYYKEFTEGKGYRPDDTALTFLGRHRVGTWPLISSQVPYYLLIVGDPEEIPYDFQYQLGVRYAVGRIHFETLEEYANYARSVVAAESGQMSSPRKAAFFSPHSPGDWATETSLKYLTKPLANVFSETFPNWEVQTMWAEDATKAHLRELLRSNVAPSLLFTASHGMGFSKDDPRQMKYQGALLCQDWPGPEEWRGEFLQEFYFSGDDVPDEANLLGRMAFFFAEYGAGTPHLDNFAAQHFKTPEPIAQQAFVARLPQRLLSHPKGGTLAVIGHIERTWGYSFVELKSKCPRINTFESTLTRLAEGYPVGLAMTAFSQHYAELSTKWIDITMEEQTDKSPDPFELAQLQTEIIDARNYVIIGDPATRLSLEPLDTTTD